jgi:chromosome segregation ATPase
MDGEVQMRETYEVGPGQTITVIVETNGAVATEAEVNALENRLKTVSRARREAEEKLAQAPTELDWAAVRAERDAASQRAARLERKLGEERQRRARDLALVESQRDGYANRIRELERLLALGAAREDALEIKVNGLMGELAGAENRARGYDQDRHTERDRANRNQEWAERAETRLAQMAQEKRDATEALADQLGKVIGAVHGYEITQALQNVSDFSPWSAQILANAIRNVRRVVGSPTPPAVSDEAPSQA